MTIMTNFSKKYYELIDQYKIAHKKGIKKNDGKIEGVNTFSGRSLESNIFDIKKIIEETGTKSILDYGCGKALWYLNNVTINKKSYRGVCDYWNINNFKLFDPGVDKFANRPFEKYDGVICTDVLEHIHPGDIGSVVKDIFSFANKFIFFDIATIEDNKILSNGDNAHLLVKPHQWWVEFIQTFQNENKGLKIVLKTSK